MWSDRPDERDPGLERRSEPWIVHLIRRADVHLSSTQATRAARRQPFDGAVADFVADCRARNLSPKTIEFYLEGLTSYRAYAGARGRALSLADLDLGIARAWLADLVARDRRPATVAARARAVRVFGRWLAGEAYLRTDPLTRLRVSAIPRTVVESFSSANRRLLHGAAPDPLGITLRILLDTASRGFSAGVGSR